MNAKPADAVLLETLLAQDSFFDTIRAHKEEWNVQIIYTQIDRQANGQPLFTEHTYHVSPEQYFYPASTIKLPVAILALQRLHELKKKGLDKYSTMLTEASGHGQTAVTNDPTTADGSPSIAHYIKKILLVSDNDAFNRLYEFLGQEYINDRLHRLGYTDVQVMHRLSSDLDEEQNRFTNPVRFVDSSGKNIYTQPAQHSRMSFAKRETKMGRGYIKNDTLINEPFNFSRKNKLSLPDLNEILKTVIFPEAVEKDRRFGLQQEDYDFLHRYMSMYPGESDFPSYDTAVYPDTFVKKFLYGNERVKPDPSIRIFNKSGTAYGFLTDAAYIINKDKKIEFLLSATIYCNSDGIFNDDKYDYDTIGYPFFKQLGRLIYDYELKRRGF